MIDIAPEIEIIAIQVACKTENWLWIFVFLAIKSLKLKIHIKFQVSACKNKLSGGMPVSLTYSDLGSTFCKRLQNGSYFWYIRL